MTVPSNPEEMQDKKEQNKNEEVITYLANVTVWLLLVLIFPVDVRDCSQRCSSC